MLSQNTFQTHFPINVLSVRKPLGQTRPLLFIKIDSTTIKDCIVHCNFKPVRISVGDK